MMKVKEENEKVGLKLNIQKKNKIVTSGHITSRQIDGGKMEIVTNFIFGTLESLWTVTVVAMKLKDAFSLEESYNKHRQHIKSRDITLPTNVHIVQATVITAITYGCESCTMKMAKHLRTGAFNLWCWRRLLSVPRTAWRSNQSILKVITLSINWEDWCWKWSSNTLATWCKEQTLWQTLWCWERLRAGGEGWMS